MSSSRRLSGLRENDGLTRRGFVTASAAGLGTIVAPSILKAQQPIKVGASMPLTGRYSREALYCVEGYRLWAKHINEMGYSYGNEDLPDTEPGLIGGRMIDLTVLDDASDPTTGARLVTHLINSENVDLLLSAYASSINLATRPIIEGAKIPTVSSSASSQDIWLGQNLQWMVQLMAPSRDRFAGLESACKEAGFKKIALIYIDDAMPIAAATGVKARIENAGLELVLYEAFPIGMKDMVPLVRKAREAGAEVLAGGGYTADAILMAKAALSLKWAPKAIWHMADFGYPDFKEALGQNAAWQCGDTEWLATADWRGNKQFVEAFRQEYNKEPEWLAAAGYGACQVLEEAVKRAGSVEDREAIRDIMFSLERETVFAKFKVNPLGHSDAGLQIGATRIGMQYQAKDGDISNEVIYPRDIATSEFVYPFRWENA
jgi:branched-chain amino acid transport system substrate-binding protein